MSYTYSARNRLIEPHNYMYTPFEGASLFRAFFHARADAIRRLGLSDHDLTAGDPESDASAFVIERRLAERSPRMLGYWQALYGTNLKMEDWPPDFAVFQAASDVLEPFSVAARVTASDLLRALVRSLIEDGQAADTTPWLDRLVQRFEVTKRLYESYPAGFRKGEGSFDSPRRYWLFALALCLTLSRSDNLRALNALLKVCDLLCSLDTAAVAREVSAKGMRVVLAAESACVRSLIDEKRLSDAT